MTDEIAAARLEERIACAAIARAEALRLATSVKESAARDTDAAAYADNGQLARLRFAIMARAGTATEIEQAILRRK